MLGAIIGDIVGSTYEFKHFQSKSFDPFFHPRAKFTDDTVCTIAIADALLKNLNPAASLKEWGTRYWKNGGWGRSFALWLADDEMKPYGSYGNGAAMRVSPAGFLAQSLDEAVELANHVTKVTHNHPEGMRGAAATASAVFLAKAGRSSSSIRQYIVDTFHYDLSKSVDEIRPNYRHNETCQNSVPQAITCVVEATSYEDAIRNAVSLGGDSDTLSAIAGGIAEAMFGIPEDIARTGWQYLPQDMREVLTALYEKT